MSTDKQLGSRCHQVDDENLWQYLKVDFHLVALNFPDNRIYGTINVIPESSRRLIKQFVLVVNGQHRIKFDSEYVHISASGFRRNASVNIEAIPINSDWIKEAKLSNVCSFYFTGEAFALSPTISFSLSGDETNSTVILHIKWYHIRNINAQQYVLYLDDKEVYYIRQNQIKDIINIDIRGFECGKFHTFQLATRFNNGKESCRSDLIEFCVPDKDSIDENNFEFITVTEQVPPLDLPIMIEITEPETNPKQNKTKQNLTRCPQLYVEFEQAQNVKRKSTCCNRLPHEKFPGIKHYFRNVTHECSYDKNKRVMSSKVNDENNNDDDDDDVAGFTSKNKN